MIRKFATGGYRLYSRKVDRTTASGAISALTNRARRRKKHEREVQYFKRH